MWVIWVKGAFFDSFSPFVFPAWDTYRVALYDLQPRTLLYLLLASVKSLLQHFLASSLNASLWLLFAGDIKLDTGRGCSLFSWNFPELCFYKKHLRRVISVCSALCISILHRCYITCCYDVASSSWWSLWIEQARFWDQLRCRDSLFLESGDSCCCPQNIKNLPTVFKCIHLRKEKTAVCFLPS